MTNITITTSDYDIFVYIDVLAIIFENRFLTQLSVMLVDGEGVEIDHVTRVVQEKNRGK